LLSTRAAASKSQGIRKPADFANRFVDMTLLNAKKRAPNSNVLGGAKTHESRRTGRDYLRAEAACGIPEIHLFKHFADRSA
jgi:hypothetical protein